MEVTRPNVFASNQVRSRSRSRSRTRSGQVPPARSSSATRRPSFGSQGKRSLSSSSSQRLQASSSPIEIQDKPVPAVSASLDNSLPLDFFKQDVVALVKTLKISKWHKKPLNPACVMVNRISGALTNSIYKIEYKDSDSDLVLPALLLRVYGKNLDSIIDRQQELEILIKLSAKNIGPKLLGIFTNGRFEQFLEGFITLNKDQIRDQVISQMIGRRMKDLHYKVPLESHETPSLPMCWKLIYKWLAILETEILPSYNQNNVDVDSIFLTSFENFKKLVEMYRTWLFGLYDESNFAHNYKFCHNDTQYGNLLLHENFNPREIIVKRPVTAATAVDYSSSAIEEDDDDDDIGTNEKDDSQVVVISTSNKKDTSLVVIDFEYSGPNFPAFELANHFSEWMSDYHNLSKPYFVHDENYPTQLQQLNLIKSYVEYDFQYPSSNLKTKSAFDDFSKTNAADLIQYEIRKLYNETIFWRATVQIYWSVWGLIQNGPVKPPASVDVTTITSKQEEQGVGSVYNISTGLDSMTLDGNVVVEDAISSSDDDFDYLKYSQQKIGAFVGDLIGLGLINKSDIDGGYHDLIKYIDCNLFDI